MYVYMVCVCVCGVCVAWGMLCVHVCVVFVCGEWCVCSACMWYVCCVCMVYVVCVVCVYGVCGMCAVCVWCMCTCVYGVCVWHVACGVWHVVCVCVFVCVWRGVEYVHALRHMNWEARVCFPQSLPALVLETESLTEPGVHPLSKLAGQ